MLNNLKLLLENEEDKPLKVGQFKKTGKLSLTSADDQIDGYLMKLQMGAVQTKKEESEDEAEVEKLAESLSKKSLRMILNEEDEAVDSSNIDVDEPADSETVSIDVSSFAKHVKEFVNLAHERLDIPSVIVNRARNLIKDKHPDSLKAFDIALKDLELGGEERFENKPDDSFQAGSMGGSA